MLRKGAGARLLHGLPLVGLVSGLILLLGPAPAGESTLPPSPASLSLTGPAGASSVSAAQGAAAAGPAGQVVIYSAGGAPRAATGYEVQQHRTGFSSLEPTLGVTPRGTIVTYGHSGSTTVIRSRDQGKTFEDVTPLTLGQDQHPHTLDPYLYVDPVTGRIFWSDLNLPCQEIGYSDDEGSTWSQTVTNCDENDHQTIFAGPPVSSTPAGYPNIVYDCAISGGVATPVSTVSVCDKSLDGGRTFLSTGSPVFETDPNKVADNGSPLGTCDGAVGHGFVGPRGTVLVPRGWCGQPWLAISGDEGMTWNRVQVAANGMPLSLYNVYEHEAGVVQDAAGNIYYMWGAHDRLPYMSVSRDGGKTWGKPVMIAPRGVRETALPSIGIDGRGRLLFGYMGSTNSPGPPFPGEGGQAGDPTCSSVTFLGQSCPDPPQYKNVTWNAYMSITADPLDASPTFVTATVNDPGSPFVKGTCGPIRCKAVYDFIDVEFAPDGTAWGVFIDGCPGGNCGSSGALVLGSLAPAQGAGEMPAGLGPPGAAGPAQQVAGATTALPDSAASPWAAVGAGFLAFAVLLLSALRLRPRRPR